MNHPTDDLGAKDVNTDAAEAGDFDNELIERITELGALRDIPNLTGRDKETLPSHDDIPTCVGLVKSHHDEQTRVMTTRASRNSEYKIEMLPMEALVSTINRCAIEDHLLSFSPSSVWEELAKHEGVDANALTHAFFVDADKAFELLLGVWRAFDERPSIDANQGQKLMVRWYLSGRVMVKLPSDDVPAFVGLVKLHAGKWGGVYLGTAFEVAYFHLLSFRLSLVREELAKPEGVGVNALTHANRKMLPRTTKHSSVASSSKGPAGIRQGKNEKHAFTPDFGISEHRELNVGGDDVTSDGA